MICPQCENLAYKYAPNRYRCTVCFHTFEVNNEPEPTYERFRSSDTQRQLELPSVSGGRGADCHDVYRASDTRRFQSST